jgi:hypothetical protein
MIHQPQQPDPEIEVAKGGKIKPVDRMPHPSAPPVHGALHGFTGGRTDNTPINVQAGSYVIPADVVSNMPGAEGNTAAGFATLERWLKSMGDPPPYPQQKDAVPIIAAKGEFVIHPSHVKKIGGGDIKKGHDILDHLVKDIRAKAVKTMSKLPGPKR